MTTDCPAWTRAIWEAGAVTNRDAAPLWSGRGEPPAVGAVIHCNDRPKTRVTVTGYEIEGLWLMVTGYRTDSPTRAGNLSGWEILWPEEA
jgi:hypothetical protein